MTISSTVNRISYSGDGVTVTFPTAFLFYSADDVDVILVLDDEDSTEVDQIRGSDYSVSGVGEPSGGTVTMATPPAVGQSLVVVRAQPYLQGMKLIENDPLPSAEVETSFDKQTIMSQQLLDRIERCVQLSKGDITGVSPILPTPEPNAFFSWNAELTGLVNVVLPGEALEALAAIVDELTLLSTVVDEITTLSLIAPDLEALAANITNLNTLAGLSTEITTLAGLSTELAALYAVAGDIAIVASHVGDVQNFADVYLGAAASDPVTRLDGSPLQVGDLYFNTFWAEMRVYDGFFWYASFPSSAPVLFAPWPATHNAVPRLSTTFGTELQNSGVLIDDLDNVTGVVSLTASGNIAGVDLTASGNIAGVDLTASGNIAGVLKDYGERVNVIGSIGGGTQNISLNDGNVVTATVDTSATTFTFSDALASGVLCGFIMYLTNGGSQTVTWPAAVDWPGGTAPSLTTAGLDILVFTTVDGGTTWHGQVAAAGSS